MYLDEPTIRVLMAAPELTTGRRAPGDTKSDAGKRIVLLPGFLRRDLERHLDWYAEKWQDGVLFVEERGKLRKARAAVALLVGFRFYDLRHTGHTLATRSGATLKDTMVRAGQSSERAALIYHHSDLEPQQEVAGVLDDLVRANPCEGQGETFWCGSGARRLNCSGQ